jgi:alkaline phosphatase D
MKQLLKYHIAIYVFFMLSCKQKTERIVIPEYKFSSDLTISFGACNNQNVKNILFKEILKNKPKAFIWGGDIIYSDTKNSLILMQNFKNFKSDSIYSSFRKKLKILGTWDDHDYGVNDGGFENPIKHEAQQIFLDFLDVSPSDSIRQQEGVYYSNLIKKDSNSVKIILLDTRYFRTPLTKDTSLNKRYIPNKYGVGTILGKRQWQWLEQELKNSKANFNVIVSSIQFLSGKHGFESWANMPHEQDKLIQLILKYTKKNTLILSGDRHIAEISKKNIGDFYYPLLDITSSGLTHAYTSFSGEENPFRISNVVNQINFGLLKFNFKNNQILFEIRGKNNQILEQCKQQY